MTDRAMDRKLAVVLAFLLLALVPLGCGGGDDGAGGDGPSAAREGAREANGDDAQEGATPGAVRAEIRGVHLRVAEGVVLEIRSLRGELVPTEEGSYPVFDDPTSFAVAIEDAEIAMSPESLAALLNGYVFAYDGAPFSDLTIELTEDGKVLQKGQMNRAGGVPFTMLGSLGVTDEGDVKIEPEELHTAGLPVENLLDFFGVELDQVVETRMRFGKLTMRDTDLEIADADPSDPFDFYLERYQEQLTAGYSKTLEDGGLVSYMPDYAEAGGTDLP